MDLVVEAPDKGHLDSGGDPVSWDLKIVGGRIIDGAPGFGANVAISKGRIVEIGPCHGPADRTIDAEGAIVTPGFVDIHTHYEGQATWDGDMLPSAQHGVTTAVMGNCGVGFAPVHDTEHAWLIQLMEGVEDIPGAALAEGLCWGLAKFSAVPQRSGGDASNYRHRRPTAPRRAPALRHGRTRRGSRARERRRYRGYARSVPRRA